MAPIRTETEFDRTQAALSPQGLTLPLPRGDIGITVADGVEATPTGQRLLALLVNVLARMKGVVDTVHINTTADPFVLPGTPLSPGHLNDGLATFVRSLNWIGSRHDAELSFEPPDDAVVQIGIGTNPGSADLVVACDAWRALLGAAGDQASWETANPIGAALAAVVTAAETFKAIIAGNGGRNTTPAPPDFIYSAFNYGVDDSAEIGPDVYKLELQDVAIAGCGAGGSGTAFILGMHPRLSGTIDLIEPGIHKVSNINRYLPALAGDVHTPRHKLSSIADHLARTAPALDLALHPRPWEQLDRHPWSTVVSAVDTVEARWQIQQRTRSDAVIIDLAVNDLLYSVLRVVPGGRCLFCKHPFDPDLAVNQRALRWGVPLVTIKEWSSANRPVDEAMIRSLAHTQNRPPEDFDDLLGILFTNTPALLECGSTSLRADVPSQAPILPLATTAVAIVGAAEVIKHVIGLPPLDNWLAHDLRRNPTGPWSTYRAPIQDCPHH
ncbi:MAG: ThiF family adenylyltransferase [Acidimicrobiia bacterium]|nr:ThiF family adenylyltransferase [Acidimicrobiia bacterium]